MYLQSFEGGWGLGPDPADRFTAINIIALYEMFAALMYIFRGSPFPLPRSNSRMRRREFDTDGLLCELVLVFVEIAKHSIRRF